MSYTKTFTALAGAAGIAVMAAQSATAETQSQPLLQDAQFAVPPMADNFLVPPEFRPFIGDLDINLSVGVDFENGVVESNITRIDVRNIECDVIEPFFEMMDAQDLADNEAWGYERSAEEQEFVDGVRELFQARVFDFNETFTAQDVMDLAGPDAIFLPSDFPAETTVDVHLECSDYEAPEPSFTPVEPN